jgi:hypothetical protein
MTWTTLSSRVSSFTYSALLTEKLRQPLLTKNTESVSASTVSSVASPGQLSQTQQKQVYRLTVCTQFPDTDRIDWTWRVLSSRWYQVAAWDPRSRGVHMLVAINAVVSSSEEFLSKYELHHTAYKLRCHSPRWLQGKMTNADQVEMNPVQSMHKTKEDTPMLPSTPYAITRHKRIPPARPIYNFVNSLYI